MGKEYRAIGKEQARCVYLAYNAGLEVTFSSCGHAYRLDGGTSLFDVHPKGSMNSGACFEVTGVSWDNECLYVLTDEGISFNFYTE